jgi:hypothetical protein
LANAGTSLYVISKLAGHATSATTERYAWVNQQTLQRESDRIGDKMQQTLQEAQQLALEHTGQDDEAA